MAPKITVTLSSRCHPECDDYWDGNWINASTSIIVGNFNGRCSESLRVEDFHNLSIEIENLNKTLKGKAIFSTLEEWLEFELIGDGKGHIEVNGFFLDEVGIGNNT